MFPSEIKVLEKKYLFIRWDDGGESRIRLANLRRYCPCAVCQEDYKTRGVNFIPLYNDKELAVEDIVIKGNYALNVKWKDGHSTGIYEFSQLKNLSE